MNAVADKLREARALIGCGWTRKEYRRNVAGRQCYCMYGALQQAINGDAEDCSVSPVFALASKTLMRAIAPRTIISFNDYAAKNKREVLAAFDKAIELAEAGQ